MRTTVAMRTNTAGYTSAAVGFDSVCVWLIGRLLGCI
jgi:hypothetical protein